jgi:putative transposase
VVRTFRYPLHPTKAQEAILESWLRACCALYNAALEHRQGAWHYEKVQRQAAEDLGVERRPGKMPSRYDQFVELTTVRASDTVIDSVPVTVLRSALGRLDEAMKSFFRRCKSREKPGYPRFRSRHRYDSFGVGRVAIDIDGKRGEVRVPKLGPVRFKAYRPLKGAVRDVTIKRTAKGWQVAIVCDLGAAPEKQAAVRNRVGIDLGLTSFAALSDGTLVENPRHYRRAEERLVTEQQVLSRKRRGSKSRHKQRNVVARAHEHVRNQRLDFHRKLAVLLFARYDLVAYEDLNVRGMVRGRMAKSIHDAGWAQFIRCLQAKAEEAGRWAVPVDPRGTSQRCSACGCTVSKDLSVRVHACPCGYVEDRDVNAAKNVLALGRSAVPMLTASVS